MSNNTYQDFNNCQATKSLCWSYSNMNSSSTTHAINGNRRRVGYRLSFWNCRKKLLNHHINETSKFVDVKCFIQKHKPHVFGLIESDLHSPLSNCIRKNKFSTEEVIDELKIDEYSLVFPDTWNHFGQARIVAYVKERN